MAASPDDNKANSGDEVQPTSTVVDESAISDDLVMPDETDVADQPVDAPPSPQESAALIDVKKLITAELGSVPLELSDIILLRYVRDNSDDNKMAAALARAGLTWRAAFHPEDIKINDVSRIMQQYEMWSGGVGKNGYPIMWVENFGSHNPQQDNTVEILESLSYIGERLFKAGQPRMNMIVSLKGASSKNFEERLMRLLMQIIDTAYPNCVGDLIVLHTPKWLKLLFMVVNPWLPKKYKGKIMMINTDYKLLQKKVEASNLPKRWGGTINNSEMCVSTFIAACAKAEGVDAKAPKSHTIPPRIRLWLSKSAVPATKIPDQVISGNLKKLGGVVKLWKSFFCVVHSGALFYFKSDSDLQPMGVILLEEAKLVPSLPNKKSGFSLAIPTRTYLFTCKNDKLRDAWVAALTPLCMKG